MTCPLTNRTINYRIFPPHKLTQWRILGEALHTHGFSGHHGNDCGISRFEGLWVVLKFLARTPVDLLLELAEFAGDVSSVAVQHRSVTLGDLSRVVQNDDLQRERRQRKVSSVTSTTHI